MRRLPWVLAVSFIAGPALAQDPEALLRNMKPAWKKVTDYTAEVSARQRVDGELYKEQISLIKFRKPGDAYAKRLNEPNKNAEAIYRGPGWNDGKIKACKGSFPNVTLSLDPYGKLATTGQNHSMAEFGLGYYIDRLLSDLTKALAAGLSAPASLGADSIDGRSCTKVGFSTDAKAGAEYTPKKGDSWHDVAKATGADWATVRYVNAGKKPGDPSAKLWAPTYYASKWEVCVDDATGLPISIKSWDHKGEVFEIYVYSKLKVNVGLTDLDFDPKNSEYGF
jgi:hypothetical protein